MPTWADFLVGLMPFALAAMLLWIRLQAAGVSTEVAVKFVAGVLVLAAIAVMGLASVVKGWREGNLGLLVFGGIAVTVSVLALRMSLQRIWEKFPLPPNGSEEGDGESNG